MARGLIATIEAALVAVFFVTSAQAEEECLPVVDLTAAVVGSTPDTVIAHHLQGDDVLFFLTALYRMTGRASLADEVVVLRRDAPDVTTDYVILGFHGCKAEAGEMQRVMVRRALGQAV